MQPLQRIFIGFVAFCATLGAAVGVLLYIAATPYIWVIGKFVAGLFITVLVCASGYSVVWTISQMSIQWSKRRQAKNAVGMVSAPADRHSIYLKPVDANYTIHEVSVNVAAASAIPQVALSKQQEQEPLPSEAWVILDMHWQGVGFKRIAEATKWTEYEVRKLCNRVDAAKKSKQAPVDFAQED